MTTPTLAEVVKSRCLLGRDTQVEKAKADVRKLLGSVEHYLSRCMEEVKGSADGQRFDDLLQLILKDHDALAQAAEAECPEEDTP